MWCSRINYQHQKCLGLEILPEQHPRQSYWEIYRALKEKLVILNRIGEERKKFIIPVVLFIMVELLVTLVEEPKVDILKNCFKKSSWYTKD